MIKHDSRDTGILPYNRDTQAVFDVLDKEKYFTSTLRRHPLKALAHPDAVLEPAFEWTLLAARYDGNKWGRLRLWFQVFHQM